jgi:hypothetical protein
MWNDEHPNLLAAIREINNHVKRIKERSRERCRVKRLSEEHIRRTEPHFAEAGRLLPAKQRCGSSALSGQGLVEAR